MSTEPHMRVAEFAARMNMSGWMVRQRIKDGEVRAVNVGTDAKPEYRIAESELARWIAAKATAA